MFLQQHKKNHFSNKSSMKSLCRSFLPHPSFLIETTRKKRGKILIKMCFLRFEKLFLLRIFGFHKSFKGSKKNFMKSGPSFSASATDRIKAANINFVSEWKYSSTRNYEFPAGCRASSFSILLTTWLSSRRRIKKKQTKENLFSIQQTYFNETHRL